MNIDREQIRRDAEWLRFLYTPVAPDRARILGADILALLAELEQAERERTGVSILEFETMRFRAERAEARLAKCTLAEAAKRLVAAEDTEATSEEVWEAGEQLRAALAELDRDA